MRLFSGTESRSGMAKVANRIPRVSSGWNHLLKSLRETEGQRILDIGPTSSTNINFLTGLGHSIYMANLVAEAADSKWIRDDPDSPFAVDEYLKENLGFSGREFDTVLLWDTLDYLVPMLRQAVITRLHQVMVPGGQLLAFFHIKQEPDLHRYHLRDDGQVESQMVGELAVREVLNNRQIENLFSSYGSYRFFLAKDNLREVVVIR